MRLHRLLLILPLAIVPPAFGQGGPPGDMPISVETTVVALGELESSVKAIGTLTAEASATLRAEVPGQIMAVHFQEGQPLKGGAKLYSIEATVLEALVNEAGSSRVHDHDRGLQRVSGGRRGTPFRALGASLGGAPSDGGENRQAVW